MANLAVVGAGVGGCSAAYFARKYLSGVNVTIYDCQDRIGGRVLTCGLGGESLELGAAFFNGFNRTLLGIAEVEGLKVAPIRERVDFGVWNGSEFVFRSSKRSFVTSLRLLAKYRLSLARAFLFLRKVRTQVAKLYQELRNPVDMGDAFECAGLDEWYKKHFLEVLIERGISEDFIDEIVTPITRAIYSQNSDLGGFAGISSLIGVYSGPTFSLVEGNSALPIRLAEASNAVVKLGAKVDVIEKMANGAYRVFAGKDVEVFDGVVVATPLDLADIKFDSLALESWEPQPYQTVYRIGMRGVFDPSYFGLKKSGSPPAVVLTTEDVGPITQYSIRDYGEGEALVTISSREPLDHDVFRSVFIDGGVSVFEHYWKAAYPVFKPAAKLSPTRLDKRLIYSSAIESSVSSMETSALSALNAVQMLSRE